MSAETVVAERWLYSTLHGDVTLMGLVTGVYAYVAPLEAECPFVVFTEQGGTDVRGVGPARLGSSLLYGVKVIGTGQSFAALETIAQRIDTLINAKSGTGVVSCVREQPLALAELSYGVEYRHLGGLYRVWAQ